MTQNSYPIEYVNEFDAYLFESIGPKGIIVKAIFFQNIDLNKYNLALCSIINGKMIFDETSDNQDIVRIFSTVAQAIFDCSENRSEIKIEIGAGDEKRLRVYNAILRRKYDEIRPFFIISIGQIITSRFRLILLPIFFL